MRIASFTTSPAKTRITALTNAWKFLPTEHFYRCRRFETTSANRLASVSTLSQAGKPAQIVVRWILRLSTGTHMEAGHLGGARPRTALSH